MAGPESKSVVRRPGPGFGLVTHSAFTICTAMSENGSRIAGTRITEARQATVPPGARVIARRGHCGTVHG